MENYELNPEVILEWALHQADYLELEKVAKGTYAVYVERRKKEFPEEHQLNKKWKKRIRG